MRIGNYYELPDMGDYALAGLKLIIFSAFIVLGWLAVNKITKFDDHYALFEEKDTGYALQRAGLVFGQSIAMVSLINTQSDDTLSDMVWLMGGGVWTLILLLGLQFLAPKIIAMGIQERRQTASIGLIRGSFYGASGLIIGAGLSGSAPSVPQALSSTFVFTLLGIATLICAYILNGLIPPYRLNVRINDGNLGSSFIASGFLIALGLVLRNAIAGDFTGWASGLIGFSLTAIIALVIFYALCLAVDRWIISNANLAEVVEGNHELAAAIVAVALISIAIGVSAVAI